MAVARWHPLESSWAKFHRAGMHLNDLDGELRRAIGEPHEAVAVERQIKGTNAVIRVTRVPHFREAGMLLGDAVTNYRAALDHLAWDFVQLGAHSRLTDKEALNVQFPLAKSAKSLREQRIARMPGIDDDEWAIIGNYQPYKRGDRAIAMRWLRKLSDTDKHRFIIPTAACLAGFMGRVTLSGCVLARERRYPPKRALYVGSHMWDMEVIPTADKFDVQVQGEMAIQPSLGHGVAVMPTLRLVNDAVLEVLSRFENRL